MNTVAIVFIGAAVLCAAPAVIICYAACALSSRISRIEEQQEHHG